MTLGALVEADGALSRLAAERLPAKAAYQVARLCRLVGAETKHFHDQRTALIKELGRERDATADEAAKGMTGPVTEVPPDAHGAFYLRLNEHAAVEVEIDAAPLDGATLPDLTAADVLVLGPLVTWSEG